MAYTKVEFKDKETPIDSENMDHVEEGIVANADAIDQLSNDLTDKADSYYFSDKNEMLEAMFNAPLQKTINLCVSGEAAGYLTNSSGTVTCRGAFCKASTAAVDFYIFYSNSARLYWGRTTSSALSALFSLTGTSVDMTSLSLPPEEDDV